MDNYTSEELTKALHAVTSIIARCEKMQGKFLEGTSQYTLLRNRIKAMYISKSLLADELAQKLDSGNRQFICNYTKEELTQALLPISSIISKCEKAQGKYAEVTPQYKRFKNIIDPMYISKSLITDELSKI